MILRPFRRSSDDRTIVALYGAIVAQARSVHFYIRYGVPDTVQGRFELIVLHLVLVLSRLGRDDGTGRRLGQGLFDMFCRDLDDNLREMGVGDLAVPKRMRRFGEAFYGRQAAYLAPLAAADREELEKAFARNIFRVENSDERAAVLARYALAARDHLESHNGGALLRGEVSFPRPEAMTDA
jgi:cytochrome b pre-mRNA-processing protein 3